MIPSAPLADRRPLGPTDIDVSHLCLGGNVFGWTADRDNSFAVLDAFVAAGGNFIDTADSYSHWVDGNSGGESETILGEWMAARGNRNDLVIATKVGKMPGLDTLTPATISAAVDDSLRRLRTDRIDLYYAHRDDTSVPLAETLSGFDATVRAGKVRYIGASNFSAERLSESLGISAANGLTAFIALQNHYNLMERKVYEGPTRDVVSEHGLASLPYYGLARGFLTGKYSEGTVVASVRAEGVAPYVTAHGLGLLQVLEAVAERHDTTMAAAALAWLLAQPTVTAPIASARTLDQLIELLPMVDVRLDEVDLAELDAASR